MESRFDIFYVRSLCHGYFLTLYTFRSNFFSYVTRMGKVRNAYKILVGKPEEKRPLGRPRRRWKDTIKMDPRKIGCGLD
jgi:hypothetical protein